MLCRWQQVRRHALTCRKLAPILILRQLTCLKKDVRKHDMVDIPEAAVSGKLRVDIEEDWHVDALSWAQPLLLKAEALDLVEEPPHLHTAPRLIRGIRKLGFSEVQWNLCLSSASSLCTVSSVFEPNKDSRKRTDAATEWLQSPPSGI
jgi:hypothetical protein